MFMDILVFGLLGAFAVIAPVGHAYLLNGLLG